MKEDFVQGEKIVWTFVAIDIFFKKWKRGVIIKLINYVLN